jgi:hypothetical protein
MALLPGAPGPSRGSPFSGSDHRPSAHGGGRPCTGRVPVAGVSVRCDRGLLNSYTYVIVVDARVSVVMGTHDAGLILTAHAIP